MRKDGRETRRNIIEKSLQIFSVKGYYNTSISDIMAATGLTKGGALRPLRPVPPGERTSA